MHIKNKMIKEKDKMASVFAVCYNGKDALSCVENVYIELKIPENIYNAQFEKAIKNGRKNKRIREGDNFIAIKNFSEDLN